MMSKQINYSENEFYIWLKTKISSAMQKDIVRDIKDIEGYCLFRTVLKDLLFETTDERIILNIKYTVWQSPDFRSYFQQRQMRMAESFQYFLHFYEETVGNTEHLKDNDDVSKDSLPFEHSSQNQRINAAPKNESEKQMIEEETTQNKELKLAEASIVSQPVTKDTEEERFQFQLNDEIQELEYLLPVAVIYFGDKYQVKGWEATYIKTVQIIQEDYPDVFEELLGKSILNDGQIDIVLSPSQDTVPLTNQKYLNFRGTPKEYIRRLQTLMDHCNADHDNVEIECIRKNPIEATAPKEDNQKLEEGQAPNDGITEILQKYHIPFFDNRDRIGCLWVYESEEANRIISDLKKTGVEFQYSKSGGRATKGKAAWWIRGRREIGELSDFQLSDAVNVESKPIEQSPAEKVPMEQNEELKDSAGNTERSEASLEAKERIAFMDWMKQCGVSNGMIGAYRGAIKKCSEYALNTKISTTSIFLIKSPEKLRAIVKNLCLDSNYPQMRSGTPLHDALMKYIDFREGRKILKENEGKTEPKPEKYESFSSTNNGGQEKTESTESLDSSAHTKHPVSEEDFLSYMKNAERLSDSTCKVYLSSIKMAESFAKTHNFTSYKLVNCDRKTSFLTISYLFDHDGFSAYNRHLGNRFTSPLNKLLNYITREVEARVKQLPISPVKEEKSTGGIDVARKETPPHSSFRDIPKQTLATPRVPTEAVSKHIAEKHPDYQKVLMEKYQKGFRLESTVELRKFKKDYMSLNGKELTESDEVIRETISRMCLVHKEKAYLPDTLINEEKKAMLLAWIQNCFNEGKEAVYYSALLREVEEQLDGTRIFDADMLKAYLKYINTGGYYIGPGYLAKGQFVQVDIADELRNTMLEAGEPLTTDELCHKLSHLDAEKLKSTLSMNSAFVRNAKGVYLHPDMLELTPLELEQISGLIREDIDRWGYAIGTEMVRNIRSRYTEILEPYGQFSDLGLRNAIAWKLEDRFDFSGNIISPRGNRMSTADIFRNFSKNSEKFSISALQQLKEDIESGILYIDIVCQNALRVSETDFVSLNQVDFDVKEIDAIIGNFCTGDYIPVQAVDEFGTFPYCGFPWNSFLLESYLYHFSQTFRLVNNGFGQHSCNGAALRRRADYSDYFAVLADALSRSDTVLNEKDSLEFFYEQGYIGRRSLKEIDKVLADAKLLRKRKG